MGLKESGEQAKDQFHNDPALVKTSLLKKISVIGFRKLGFFFQERERSSSKEKGTCYIPLVALQISHGRGNKGLGRPYI